MPNHRNVLFIIIDQLRADCLHGRLASHVALPNLRALQKDAVTFERHFSTTNPCGPSRASILTGRYAMNHRAVRNGTPLPHDMPNVATEARKAGYLPLLFGYTDIAQDPRTRDPNDPALKSYEQVIPGFDEALEMRLEESWPWRADLKAKGYDVPAYPDIFRPIGSDPSDPALYRAEDSDTAFLASRMINELSVRPKGWFAHATFIRPHPPLVAPEPYNRMYDPANLPSPVRPRQKVDEYALHPLAALQAQAKSFASNVEGFPDLPETDENIAKLRSIYLGLATEVDHHIGRIIAFLKESGQYDDTLIIVTADHGEMLGDYHGWGKMSFYDAAYHTPLIIRDPDHAEHFGTTVVQPTESVDVAPTILDHLGVDIPDTMDGRSLKPFLQGTTPADWKRHSFSELDYGDPVEPTIAEQMFDLDSDQANLAILRDGRYTLVHFNGGFPQLLFDHEKDGEARNIAEDPEAAGVLLDLTRKMLDHRMTHTDGRFAKTMITEAGAVRAARKS